MVTVLHALPYVLPLLLAVTIAAGAVAWMLERRAESATDHPGGDEAWATELGSWCRWCPAAHCAGCAAPARTMATWTAYQPRHGWDEVPPSMRRLAELLPVALRAITIARAVGPRWTPRGGGSRVGLEAWAARVAHRHNIPSLLGTFRKQRLP